MSADVTPRAGLTALLPGLASGTSGHAPDALVLAGIVAQSVYVGHGVRNPIVPATAGIMLRSDRSPPRRVPSFCTIASELP